MARPASSWIGPGLAAWLVATTAVVACSQAPAPETPGPEAPDVETIAPDAATVVEPMPEEAQAEATEGTGAEAQPERNDGAKGARAARRADDATVVPIVEPRNSKPRTLWEAAAAAREERQKSPRPRISINDENLHEYQDAALTFAEPEEKAAGEGDESDGEAGSEDQNVRGEEYWRSTVRDLRLRLRTAVDELDELDDRAAGLRRSFYAEDDPYVRDGEIKPAWDRALDRIDETRRDIVDLQRELDDTLEEGREAGALPGWLREGIELEPEPDELPQPRSGVHEPGEPEVMEIEPPPGRPW